MFLRMLLSFGYKDTNIIQMFANSRTLFAYRMQNFKNATGISIINFPSNPWWIEGKCLSLQSRFINLKLVCLCLFHVCVAEKSSLKIGPGMFVIPVAIVYAHRVFLVSNALNVLGGI